MIATRDTKGRVAPTVTPEQIRDAFARYDAKQESPAAIAASIGVHRNSLLRLIRGMPGFAEASRNRPKTHMLWPMRDDELRALRAQGLERVAIAAAMGLTVGQVRWRLSAIGVRKPAPTPEEMRQREMERERRKLQQQRLRRRAKPKVVKAPRVVTPRRVAPPPPPPPPVPVIPVQRGKPGVWLPPVPRTWEDIVDLAWRDGVTLHARHELPGWNRSRVARGDAPLCIKAGRGGFVAAERVAA